jgi:3-deoxy-manno-octulosonate cytidylyltransferase (CMP-KDO synthetase)
MKIACVIPARLKSTRFPRKMLSFLKNKPLLQWVWEAANKTLAFDSICFAIDSNETARLIEGFGGKYFMTSEDCASGTDRLVELYNKKLIDADVWVNWQGDEPFINAEMIQDLLRTCGANSSDIWTLKKKITKTEEIPSPQYAKVVCDAEGYALYFSRSIIPYYRDPCPDESKIFYKHIGIYAYSKQAIQKISNLSSSCYLEEAEKLEQLRFLFYKLRIQVHETRHDVMGIDLPEHLAQAEARISSL